MIRQITEQQVAGDHGPQKQCIGERLSYRYRRHLQRSDQEKVPTAAQYGGQDEELANAPAPVSARRRLLRRPAAVCRQQAGFSAIDPSHQAGEYLIKGVEQNRDQHDQRR